MGFVKDVWNGITGKTQANAAKKAAKLQQESADKAIELQKQMYDQSRADIQPWRNAGMAALGQLKNKVNSDQTYKDNYGAMIKSKLPSMLRGSDKTRFNDGWANTIKNNYAQGKYTGGLEKGFFKDPSYEFRRDEGMRGLQASASARGGLLSGAALKAMSDYNSGLASQEYQAAYNRHRADQQQQFAVDTGLRNQDYQLFTGEQTRLNNLQRADQQHQFNVLNNLRNQDYNIFNSENTRQYNQLANLAGVGQTAGQTLASLGQNYAGNASNAMMQGANAAAAGRIGAANAQTGGLGNLLKLGGMAFGGAFGGLGGAAKMGGLF